MSLLDLYCICSCLVWFYTKFCFCFALGHAASSSSSSSAAASDKLSLKRVLDLVTSGGDRSADSGGGGDMREMNRKLQTMLEETLTKNMHLQQVANA